MKLVFLGAYYNHHQKFLAEALAKRCSFTYISTSKIPAMRKSLGWGLDQEPDYVIRYDEAPDRAQEKLKEAQVILTGSAPEELVRGCIQRGQLVLRYSERPLKKGLEPLKYLPRLVKWHLQNPKGKPIYMLCASGYTASDYAKFGLFRNRALRWGYFPETKKYDIDALLAQKKKASILWVGRFLDWKHPDDALAVAAKLKKEDIAFEMKLIGTGPMEEQLRQMLEEEGLSDRVEMPGAMKPEEVRRHMEQARILLFTSDRQEGWGAVLNEAMNSGCAVVASHAAGSAAMLVRSGENGLFYTSGDGNALYEKTKKLLMDDTLRQKLGKAAYETIAESWNAETAAERLVELSRVLLNGGETPYEEGPCSKAEIFRKDWYKDEF